MRLRVLAALLCLWPVPARAGQTPAAPDPIDLLVARVEQAIAQTDAPALRALFNLDEPSGMDTDFVNRMTLAPVSHVTVKLRDRAPRTNGEQRLRLEIFADRRGEGTLSTWRVDAKPSPLVGGLWQIAALERLSVVSGLYRLALDPAVQFDVRNLSIREPDLLLTMNSGRAFAASTAAGTTVLVLLGKGHLTFSPSPPAERGQVHIFCGADALSTSFKALFLRINPQRLSAHLSGSMVRRTPRPDDLRRAQAIFSTYSPLTFQVDISDLSADKWSLVPTGDDAVAEMVTSKYGTLTYARGANEPEDISLFDRRHRRNISVYASADKLAAHGRDYSEDDGLDYDVLHYDIDTTFSPDRLWVDGVTRLTLRIDANPVSTITIRLADALVIRSATSPQFGRLLTLRIVGQNTVVVGFPATVPAGAQLDVTMTYGGRLTPQPLDRETVQVVTTGDDGRSQTMLEPRFLYSNRSFWYPQGTVTDYATARISLTIPADYTAVASGTPQGPATLLPAAPGTHARTRAVFAATSPARYLAFLVSHFDRLAAAHIELRTADALLPAGGAGRTSAPATFTLLADANPREGTRAHELTARAADVLRTYTSILGDAPYGTLTLAITESQLPGGHGPAYLAIVDQPAPTSPFVWSSDPVAFDHFPAYFLAHEVAHQWWGQAVGWKNYHEQWLSEGFAQYFAALYAERHDGEGAFEDVIRKMRKWGMQMSPKGPISLGYRLGHIKNDSRVFRAIVYDKAAMVLHMLRRLVGDDAFFAGLRRFYTTWRFKKAGTADFQAAMEAVSGRPLGAFFDAWIRGTAIPRLRFSSVKDASGRTLTVRFEQTSPPMEVPVTVTLEYADGSSESVVVDVDRRIVERRLPLKGRLDRVDVNRDSAALADIDR
ncbi:MAG TPA: M1 family aminopeptidase [Vicinamibacterales bacterium]|nr:M1 family aminopeptidase [Vicinamibacterales bacterium]